jgi:hypothetical protein
MVFCRENQQRRSFKLLALFREPGLAEALHFSLSCFYSTFFLFFLIKKERKKSRAVETGLKICAGA